MAVGTGSFAGVDGWKAEASHHVFNVSNGFQVRWIYAAPHPAQVINRQTAKRLPIVGFISPTVDADPA